MISSPDVPLFYITGSDVRTALITGLPILAEMIERNQDMPSFADPSAVAAE